MKIIDLLNKIANGEKVPKEIEYRGTKFLYDILNQCYIEENYNKYNDLLMELSDHKGTDLNYEVEIIEEDKKIARLNQDNFQCVSNLEVSGQSANYFEYGIEDEIRDIVDKINEIIDYLMEKKQ